MWNVIDLFLSLILCQVQTMRNDAFDFLFFRVAASGPVALTG